MKKLILMRHGKSSWDYTVSDRDRPLKERGIADAHLVSKKFLEDNSKIDFVFASPANRALHTAMIFCENLSFNLKDFRITEELYDFSGIKVAQFVNQLDDRWSTVILFGHNHAYTSLANTWGDRYIDNLPTSGLVQLEFKEHSWAAITKGITTKCIFPKQLKA